MKSTTSTGYEPVPSEAMSASHSADLAEELASRNYNWDCLAELLVDFTPEDASEMLKLVYFEYSRLVILNPEEVTTNANNLLFQIQRLCEVFRRMATSGRGCLALVPVANYVESQS